MKFKHLSFSIFATLLVSTLTHAAPSSPIKLSCQTLLPLGDYKLSSFATYEERQKNPNQNDLDSFSITNVTNDNQVIGYVSHNQRFYRFTAQCQLAQYNGFTEVRLAFNAASDSFVNKCSGILNAVNPPGSYFGRAMYIGGSDLITGDTNYTTCEGNRYGTVLPPEKN